MLRMAEEQAFAVVEIDPCNEGEENCVEVEDDYALSHDIWFRRGLDIVKDILAGSLIEGNI